MLINLWSSRSAKGKTIVAIAGTTRYFIAIGLTHPLGAVCDMLFHDLIFRMARRSPTRAALVDRAAYLSYADLAQSIAQTASGLQRIGLSRGDRLAIYLDKQAEAVAAIFAATAAGGVAVPCNPLLKTKQLAHIVRDAGCRVLVTSWARYERCRDDTDFPSGITIVVVDADASVATGTDRVITWPELLGGHDRSALQNGTGRTDSEIAALLYTSGSTGRPKGVVLSHRNLVAGAESVASYLGNHADDVILAVLPLSFDAGLSQLTTAFHAGATAVLHNYLLPGDVAKVCHRYNVTGLTAVPAIWRQLMRVSWPSGARNSMRYFANTGGHMPGDLLKELRATFPQADPVMMYGLTEAFRSTYLPPTEVDRRPQSIGKAIPNAEILVVRPDGSRCAPGEVGELVHKGPLVARGYWKDPELTRMKFRPAPDQPLGRPSHDLAVYSGDLVRKDEEGFLYFVGRDDEMIKVGGVRVSPTEVEEVVNEHESVGESVAFGLEHPMLGQAVVVCYVPKEGLSPDETDLIGYCRRNLATFMVPARIVEREALPLSPNGKVDRKTLRYDYQGLLTSDEPDSDSAR
jgi:acyl-CoA ligase (AMP-forming) (exosortase A-associated)